MGELLTNLLKGLEKKWGIELLELLSLWFRKLWIGLLESLVVLKEFVVSIPLVWKKFVVSIPLWLTAKWVISDPVLDIINRSVLILAQRFVSNDPRVQEATSKMVLA